LGDIKVRIGINADNKITFMEPLDRVAGKAVKILIARVRLVTDEERPENIEKLMKEGHVYKRVGRRVREVR